MAMMAITTSNSIKVKPRDFLIVNALRFFMRHSVCRAAAEWTRAPTGHLLSLSHAPRRCPSTFGAGSHQPSQTPTWVMAGEMRVSGKHHPLSHILQPSEEYWTAATVWSSRALLLKLQ